MSHLALLKDETQAIKNPPPTFQTVSPRTRVNNGKKEEQRLLHRSPTGCLSGEVRDNAEVVNRPHAHGFVEDALAGGDIKRGTVIFAAHHDVVDAAAQLEWHLATSHQRIPRRLRVAGLTGMRALPGVSVADARAA
jgi:hypothetical protein